MLILSVTNALAILYLSLRKTVCIKIQKQNQQQQKKKQQKKQMLVVSAL